MINLSLSEATAALSGNLFGRDSEFTGVSTDTRRLSEGQLFVAILGERFDGHHMLAEAKEKGAIGALVNRKSKEVQLPQISVSDTKVALGSLARYWRRKFRVPVIAVTGSAGKTTVKNMLASILGKSGPVLATPANMNNEIGLPLTLFGLSGKTKAVVLEMGASKQGDIKYLAEIAEPSIGAITLCSPAHLSGFGTMDNIAKTKGELISALPKNGTAILNSDDDYFDYWRDLAHPRELISFGSSGYFSFSEEKFRDKSSGFLLRFGEQMTKVSIRHLGRHNIMNALTASAAAFAIGLMAEDMRLGLDACSPAPGRLYPIRGKHRLNILDDSYNANPSALTAALEVLSAQSGQKWVVIGDMNELGDLSEDFHRQAGKRIGDAGVDRLFTIGEKAVVAARSFSGPSEHFSDVNLLIERLSEISAKSSIDICLLVKGSRSMKLENVVEALAASKEE